MLIKRTLVFAITLMLCLFFSGCVAPGGINETGETGNETITGVSLELPLHLEYETKARVGEEEISRILDFWIESEINCNGKEAYYGIMGYRERDAVGYAKITVYKEDGAIAISTTVDESNLAFTNAIASGSFSNHLPLMINDIFKYAGKNFMESNVWDSTTPELLNNVVTPNGMLNYSVFNKGANNSFSMPCIGFNLFEKGMYVDSKYYFCVLDKEDYEFPFVVNSTDTRTGKQLWALTLYEEENSNIDSSPECIEFIKCPYVELKTCPSGEQLSTEQDEKGCIKEYKCLTLFEQAEWFIRQNMPNDCELIEGLVQEVLDCYTLHQPNFNPQMDIIYTRDENECIIDTTCRED